MTTKQRLTMSAALIVIAVGGSTLDAEATVLRQESLGCWGEGGGAWGNLVCDGHAAEYYCQQVSLYCGIEMVPTGPAYMIGDNCIVNCTAAN